MKYVVLYEKTPNNFGAWVPDLPGCVALGDTLAETEKLIREAIELHLEGMREQGEEIPHPSELLGEVEVA